MPLYPIPRDGYPAPLGDSLIGCRFQKNAFTLVELLVVMAIMIAMVGLLVPALSGLKGSGDITKTAYDISGSLELARTYAMGNNTYVWVGFFEEDPTKGNGNPGQGRLIVSIVASKDGTKIYQDASSPAAPLDATRLTQVSSLLKFNNTHLDLIPAENIVRPILTSTNSQVADSSFDQPAPNGTTFTYPLSGKTYTFAKIIQFSPRGDATRIVSTSTRLMEIGLRPTHGNVVDGKTLNLVAVQIAGIGGQVKLYRP